MIIPSLASFSFRHRISIKAALTLFDTLIISHHKFTLFRGGKKNTVHSRVCLTAVNSVLLIYQDYIIAI